ncbi:MAG TPA: redoxin domain-containing protein [Gemmatimonadales bacterium]|nr:redoxin domain-containing protein [Gemmatimonadales bacterium]
MNAYRDQYATLFRNGRGVVLLAVSADPADTLAAWAREAEYPFLFLSDPDGEVGRRYGAWSPKWRLDNRTLFVVAPGGRIAHRQAPFRELDPSAYRALAAAVDSIAGP